MDARDIIRKPIITEKSNLLMAEGKYTFQVAKTANKTEIAKAVEDIFKVTVLKVNTMRVHGKTRRQGKFVGQRPDWKKAIVQLAEGQSITIFEGL